MNDEVENIDRCWKGLAMKQGLLIGFYVDKSLEESMNDEVWMMKWRISISTSSLLRNFYDFHLDSKH